MSFKNMVISGGVNVCPAEIEAESMRHDRIRDCAVFGIPDEEFGEALCAVVEPVDGNRPEPDLVHAFLRERRTGHKVPRLIEIVERLPRDDSAKVFKHKLREPYRRDAERNI